MGQALEQGSNVSNLVSRMVSVTARKIRDHGRERVTAVSLGRVYTGYLISYPVVGRGMVIFRDPNGHRMVTTPVKRVLGEPDGGSIYVETENSVYRLEFHSSPVQAAPEEDESEGARQSVGPDGA